MPALKISEAAAATGFTADTLRFYERSGVLVPSSRSDAGYRLYDEDDVAALRFIAHAKSAGLALDDIGQLVELWRTGECGSVRDRLHDLVCERAAAAREQAVDLVRFADDLDRLLATLAGPETPERCGPTCGCGPPVPPTTGTAPASDRSAGRVRIPVAVIADGSEVAEACTLPSAGLDERLQQWRAALASSSAVQPDVTSGDGAASIVVTLPSDPSTVARVAELSALEQECCGGGLRFTLEVGPGRTTVTVTGALVPALAEALELT